MTASFLIALQLSLSAVSPNAGVTEPLPNPDSTSEQDDAEDEGILSGGTQDFSQAGFCLGANCMQQLACMGCQTMDQQWFGGKFSAVYNQIVMFSGVGSAIGLVIGIIGGLLPGGYLGYQQYTQSGGADACGALYTFAIWTGIVAVVMSFFGAVIGGAVGLVYGAYLVFLTDDASQVGVLPGANSGRSRSPRQQQAPASRTPPPTTRTPVRQSAPPPPTTQSEPPPPTTQSEPPPPPPTTAPASELEPPPESVDPADTSDQDGFRF